MNSGMRDTGTDTSWAMLPPAATCASDQALAHLPQPARPARRRRRSARRGRGRPRARRPAPRPAAPCSEPGGPWLVTSISTYQGCTSAIGSSWPGTPVSSKSMIGRPISSKAETVSPRRRAHVAEQRHAGGRRVDADPRGLAGGRLGEQAQHRGRDDAERALGADEQLLHVVAGVVLAQAAQAVPDAAVGQHHLQPEHQVARVAVAQHVARRRRWWRCCRRSGRSLPRRGSGGTAGRRGRPRSGSPSAPRRPPP